MLIVVFGVVFLGHVVTEENIGQCLEAVCVVSVHPDGDLILLADI